MKTHHEMVREFNTTFGAHMEKKPGFPPPLIENMRERLIEEEHRELLESQNGRNLEGVLDAICDLLYVTYGAADAYGFSPELLSKAFREVHRSNMSKLWSQKERDEHIAARPDTELKFKEAMPGLYIATRTDGKVIKSPGYSPANLKAIIAIDRAIKA